MLIVDNRYFVDFRDARKTRGEGKSSGVGSVKELDKEEMPTFSIWNAWGLAIAPRNPEDRGDHKKWTL